MAQAKKDKVQEAVNLPEEDGKLPVEPQEPVKPAETPEESKPVAAEMSNLVFGEKEATVLNEQGTEIRTYSLEVHGKEYKELARQYAQKVIDQANEKPRRQ